MEAYMEREAAEVLDNLTTDNEATQFRNLVKEVSRKSISSEQARHFLDIFGSELEVALVNTRREFVEKHFGTKN